MYRWARGLFGAALVLLALYGVKKVCEPPPVVCPPPRPIVVQYGNETERTVIRLTNAERVRRGLQPLKVSPQMMTFARNWSAVQSAGRMHHSRGPYGENVAKGYPTPEATVNAWMRSPGHRRNILNPRYSEIGVGQVGVAYTQVFR